MMRRAVANLLNLRREACREYAEVHTVVPRQQRAVQTANDRDVGVKGLTFQLLYPVSTPFPLLCRQHGAAADEHEGYDEPGGHAAARHPRAGCTGADGPRSEVSPACTTGDICKLSPADLARPHAGAGELPAPPRLVLRGHTAEKWPTWSQAWHLRDVAGQITSSG